MSKLQVADEEYYLNSEYLLKIATHAKELFESSEPQEKRLILKMAFQNLSLDGKIVRYDWKKPFDKIAFYAARPAWLDKRSFNITKELGRIIKIFEDFKLVAQIREEIEKVRPCIVLAIK